VLRDRSEGKGLNRTHIDGAIDDVPTGWLKGREIAIIHNHAPVAVSFVSEKRGEYPIRGPWANHSCIR
jgi:hypothetical protein